MIPLIDSSCDCSTQSVQTQGLTISALKQALMSCVRQVLQKGDRWYAAG